MSSDGAGVTADGARLVARVAVDPYAHLARLVPAHGISVPDVCWRVEFLQNLHLAQFAIGVWVL